MDPDETSPYGATSAGSILFIKKTSKLQQKEKQTTIEVDNSENVFMLCKTATQK